jgi:hypothetical protein
LGEPAVAQIATASTWGSTDAARRVAASVGSYDASIGLGVDVSGFADLSLRSGGRRYFVNSATGSDENSCAAAQVPSMPKASGAAALACTTDGEADQILFAEGTRYNSTIPSMAFRKGGYSLAYPFVVQSYDPADPLNQAKYGRATGNNRPVFTGNTAGTPWIFGNTGQRFIAVRGLDINPGNVSGQSLSMVNIGDGILFENNLLRYTGLALSINGSPTAHHWIFRSNAIYGNWDANPANHSQGLYADGSDSLTIEDNVFWHNGWKVGATRDDPAGGATMFRHPIYQQVPTDAVVRRNLVIDGSADGGSHRGKASISENVYIDNPISISAGGGVDYDKSRPYGVDLEISYNAILGSAAINSKSNSANGWGISTANGTSSSSAHHNLIARSGALAGPAFQVGAGYNQPSYMKFYNNVSYLWSSTGSSWQKGGAYLTQAQPTFDANFWDDPTLQTNTNVGSYNPPNPYTLAQLCAALGFSSKQAWIDYAIMHPEKHPARNARALLFTGYGLK